MVGRAGQVTVQRQISPIYNRLSSVSFHKIHLASSFYEVHCVVLPLLCNSPRESATMNLVGFGSDRTYSAKPPESKTGFLHKKLWAHSSTISEICFDYRSCSFIPMVCCSLDEIVFSWAGFEELDSLAIPLNCRICFLNLV